MTRPAPAPDFDTVILAGGRAARMGGADKPGLTATDTPMLVSVARAAAAAGTARLVVVGPARPGAVQAALAALAAGRHGWLTYVQEHPPGGGPVAGLRRGLAEVSAPRVALLAADLPFLTGADLMRLLTADVSGDAVGLVLADAEGRPQWLASCWQSPTLRAAAAGYDGDSLHGLLAPLRPTPAPVLALARPDTAGATMPPWLDCDTPDDLAAARRAWLAKAADSGGQR